MALTGLRAQTMTRVAKEATARVSRVFRPGNKQTGGMIMGNSGQSGDIRISSRRGISSSRISSSRRAHLRLRTATTASGSHPELQQ